MTLLPVGWHDERDALVLLLGDDDVGMRVRPWLDEGVAEIVSAEVCDRHDLVAAALDRATRTPFVSLAEVDAALRDLDSPNRALAFPVATALVHALGGAGSVFHHLDAFGTEYGLPRRGGGAISSSSG